MCVTGKWSRWHATLQPKWQGAYREVPDNFQCRPFASSTGIRNSRADGSGRPEKMVKMPAMIEFDTAKNLQDRRRERGEARTATVVNRAILSALRSQHRSAAREPLAVATGTRARILAQGV
jgi:hypothetical protein